MKITIVTVAYNEEKNIAKTIESVLNQTTADIEYIVCDGKSSDRTPEIAKLYHKKFASKGIKYVVNSEKDTGIYDAMNKGIEKANGEYILFLNAGDILHGEKTLENVIKKIKENNNYDFVYGNVDVIERGVVSYRFNGDDSNLLKEMSVPHPALFSKTSIMKEVKFDIQYKIAADYNFVLSQKLARKTFFEIDETITWFFADGVSSKNIALSVKERESIKQKYGLPADTTDIKKDMLQTKIRVFIKNSIPQKLWELWSVKIKGKELYVEQNSVY